MVLLTAGGRGVPMLAASYATNGLDVLVRVPDYRRFPVDAEERRDAFPVGEADAAVVAWADRDPDVRRVLRMVERKGIPVHVIGEPERTPRKVKRARHPSRPRAAPGLTGPRGLAPIGG